ncbi:MAG: peptide-methionine (S)-S-oxide reductase MsrA [Puniceicoccales bacterium]|nr:peptide-methionine (S)-S-oxide reductase MsrA [Puniceicoccales bacterium]
MNLFRSAFFPSRTRLHYPADSEGLPSAGESPTSSTDPIETLILGGGCFWCLEAIFQKVKGVQKVTSGYAGGTVDNPTYKQVCTGSTGHAEVVQIQFDSRQILCEALLKIFWHIHDPTTLNKQGEDIGTQYRSVIFFSTPEQKAVAEGLRAITQDSFAKPIVTEILPLEKFWPAEDYHQDYFNQNPNQPYCSIVIAPKLRKFLKSQE